MEEFLKVFKIQGCW